jgi:glycosyltransferase involved in cell wall biosynthesis
MSAFLNEINQSLVSVIIPCYNHAHFLPDAINSVLSQNYNHVEIIVVDDGSTDNTKEKTAEFVRVNYFYQSNQGLSAARNTGIKHSSGKYLIFLDADDYLLPEAISTNVLHLEKNPSWAFVSGWHDKVDEWKYPIEQDEQILVHVNHYQNLLCGNYIGMHATVLYQRWVFDEVKFDASLKACEDYDLYFKIARKFPIGNHSKKIAAYRIHGKNMSARIPFMLEHVLLVLNRQEKVLQNDAERHAYKRGILIWKEYYQAKLYNLLIHSLWNSEKWASRSELALLSKKPLWLLNYIRKRVLQDFKNILKRALPDAIHKILFRRGFFENYIPPVGKVKSGDFERVTPFSVDFGFDRGGPIDRYYVEYFLQENKSTIKGRVLEIGDNEYTLRFGEKTVVQSDILHIDEKNTKATFIGDLSNAPHVPSDSFDCIVLTQTLHFIYDFRAALQTCYRILKPGGCLLLTVPGISHIDRGEWREYWLYAFTDKSMKRLMHDVFHSESAEIRTYGNVYVAAAFLYGMGLPEFNKKYLSYNDPSYQVIISVKVIKQ